jgi:catechol 2,3-dioxygenase
MEIVVTDLAKSREFYVDVLGLHVTEEDENTIYLRSLEEFIHHNLVLRQGPIAAVAAFAYRVKSPAEVDAAEAYYKELGCRTERRKEGFTKGIGDSVRVEDPLGFPYEFFYETEHVERLTQRYDLYSAGELVRLDHFNQVTPDVPRGRKYLEDLGFRVSEDIKDADGVTYAAWMHRKQTVHDTALTGGNGPRMHHVAFATHEKHNIIQICDKMGALRISDRIERGPGRHGVSNAFYLYILDPGLLHRRPGQPHHHLGRPRQPAPRLVGQPRGPVLVHRGLPGPGPGRQPAAGHRPRRKVRDGRDRRSRRLLLHPQGRNLCRGGGLQAGSPGLNDAGREDD